MKRMIIMLIFALGIFGCSERPECAVESESDREVHLSCSDETLIDLGYGVDVLGARVLDSLRTELVMRDGTRKVVRHYRSMSPTCNMGRRTVGRRIEEWYDVVGLKVYSYDGCSPEPQYWWDDLTGEYRIKVGGGYGT